MVVADVILVSALWSKSFFSFLGDFYSTWGPVGTGAWTWTWTRASPPNNSGQKVLIVKLSQNDPLDSPSQKNWPGGQQDQGHEVVLHVQEEVYWWTLTFRRSVAKYHGGSMRCPKFRNYDVSPGTKHKRGVKSRVKKLSVTRDQNSIFFLKLDPTRLL